MKDDTLPEYPSLTSPIFLEGVTASQFMVEEPSETKPMNYHRVNRLSILHKNTISNS